MSFFATLGNAIWTPWLLGLFLLVGGYYSLRTGFFQFFGLRTWWARTMGSLRKTGKRRRGERGAISQLQAMSTALAATIGTGSIAGVATAIFFGGPGAVFWMWISAFLGMMTGCAEKTLAVRYREKDPAGGWRGGPMCYIRDGLGLRWLAVLFSIVCVGQTLAGGNLVQANSIATALNNAFGFDKLAVGVVTALLAGIVVLGGIGRIGTVSERLVPAMAFLFVGTGLIVIILHASALPDVFHGIFQYAFQPKAVAGGYGMGLAMRFGIARGVFTNEAGLGTSAMAHAAADVEEPAEQGMWGIFEVFAATLVVCTVTALVILSTGVYTPEGALAAIQSGDVPATMLGAPLTSAAFATVFGGLGPVIVSVSLMLFAFTSLLGSCYYGQRGIESLTQRRGAVWLYRAVFLGVIVVGCLGDLTVVWQLVDVFNGLLAAPNLLALLLLSPEALRLIKKYTKEKYC